MDGIVAFLTENWHHHATKQQPKRLAHASQVIEEAQVRRGRRERAPGERRAANGPVGNRGGGSEPSQVCPVSEPLGSPWIRFRPIGPERPHNLPYMSGGEIVCRWGLQTLPLFVVGRLPLGLSFCPRGCAHWGMSIAIADCHHGPMSQWSSLLVILLNGDN
jgi:hypothetical protein